MTEVEIFTTPFCPYCVRAKRLLTTKSVAFKEVDLYATPERRDEMVERAGGRTSVPQIFINGTHVGGSDDLAALERDGKLDPMLQGAA